MTYLRCPSIAGDHVVFVGDDDVWRVGTDGGRAERLSSDRVAAARPRLSRDGRSVAWTSRRDGNPEVYVAPVDGGPGTRLSYWNQLGTRLLGWSADGQVIACSPVGQPFRSRTWAYALDVDGGPAQRLPYGPINGLARRPGGATVLISTLMFREPAAWKRYRGGTRGRFWIDPVGDASFEPFLAEIDGQLADPVWVGDRLAFVSDHEGHGNVYSVDATGGDLRRHSDHTGQYARDLSADLDGAAAQLVYACAGRLYRLDDLSPDARPVPLEIDLPGARVALQPGLARPKDALYGAEAVSVDASGRASVVDIRGTVQWLTHRDGPVRSLSARAGVRTRLPRVMPGEHSAVWVTDAQGDDALEFTAGGSTRVIAAGQLGRVLELAVSPDGADAAVATHDGRVLVVALSDGAVREINRSEAGDASGLTWSPDSEWLAWSMAHPAELRSIQLADRATGTVASVTPERFVDTSPTFSCDGRYLAYLSARTFDPVYDTHNFDLSFPVGVRPYLVPLAADIPSPFDPMAGGRPIGADDTPPAPGSTPSVAPTVRVDVDGIADRTVVVPVDAGRLAHLRAVKDGLVWLNRPVAGDLGTGRPVGAPPPRPALWRWDFPRRRGQQLVEELDWFAASGDGTRVLVRDGDALRVISSERPAPKGPPKDDAPARDDVVEVDLDRIQVHIHQPAEWGQMMDETWRLMRDHFWIGDMGGVDWPAVLERYRPVVERIATRDDLSEVLWEMIGELGSSHAYERQNFPPPPPGRIAAFLGADLARRDDGRWVIERILPGESSVPDARSPLRAAGADVRDGDVLVAVNAVPVGPSGPAPVLVGLAGKPIELTLERGGVTLTSVVVPVEDETPIRYHDWVADRRRVVHAATDGRVGYVHVPDMAPLGWAEFNRDLRRELERDALILDTRDNGGGHVSQLVLERLARRPIGGDVVRHGFAERYPSNAPRGPLLSLANEYAGSDGDIVNEAFREMGLGPIVGTRTWGGVIGIDGRYFLVDGTSVTQPRYAFWFRDAGWGVENYGVDPDVEVPHPPQAWAAGTDPQLEEGLRVITAALQASQPLQPTPLAGRPDRAAPPLPPRP